MIKKLFEKEILLIFTDLTCIFKGSPLDSILEAVLTVSPKRQYRGILIPTTPAQQGPEFQKL